MDWPERLLVILVTIGIAVMFGFAVWLIPDLKGYGTHRQLGLPECTFRSLMGVSCPHCGLTTSICWFVRGQWGMSMRSNPAGLLLAVICAGIWPWCVLVSFKGVWLGTRNPGRIFLLGFACWLMISLILWIPRLM